MQRVVGSMRLHAGEQGGTRDDIVLDDCLSVKIISRRCVCVCVCIWLRGWVGGRVGACARG